MRISIISESSKPTINHAHVLVTQGGETLISMNINLPERERNEGSLHAISETLESSVRRILKDVYPGARGVRTVIYV